MSIKSLVVILAMALFLAVGCAPAATPEPQIIVVTATPDPAPTERTIAAAATPISATRALPTPRATPTVAATPTPMPTAKMSPTPRATPTAEPESLIIRRPTPTHQPTATVGPTQTPAPTPWPMSDTGDICYRSPAVQYSLMQKLNVNLCQAITIGELFRLEGSLSIEDITLHPQDLEGLVNLKELRLSRTNLQYQDLQHTPNVIDLDLSNPVNYKHLKLGHLTKLQDLYLETRNAECTLLRTGYIRQLLDGLENLQEVSIRGYLYMPSDENRSSRQRERDLVNRRIQAEVLRAANSPDLERDNISVSIELYDPDEYPDRLPPCSEGH